jgi:AraC-like DNA-binding protein
MSEVFAMVKGEFGKVVVLEVRHGLVHHAHSEIQFGYWLGGGEGCGIVNDESVVYSKATAVCINRYQTHNLIMSEDGEPIMMLLLYIDENWFDDHFSNKGSPISFRKAQNIYTSEMKLKCWALMQKTLLSTELDLATFEANVSLLLKLTIESNVENTTSYSNSIHRKMPNYRLRLALAYLRDNAMHGYALNDLSKMVGISRSRLYELFKIELQSTPKLILNSFLLDDATRHIVNSEDELSVISKNFGFSTAANFSRFFRAHKGVAPTTYRKNVRYHSI